MRPSKFKLLEHEYQKETYDFLSNEAISQKSLKKGVVEDITPNKPSLNIMHLLSNLEGLTPAGLDHLMETQDRLACTAKTADLKRNDTLLSN